MTRAKINRRSLLATASALSLTACVRVPTLMIVPEAAQSGVAETVFVASNRVFANGQFQSARQDDVTYTRFTVQIPQDRDAGAVRPGRARRTGPNLRTDFVASDGVHLGGEGRFQSELLAEARRRGTSEVMVSSTGSPVPLEQGSTAPPRSVTILRFRASPFTMPGQVRAVTSVTLMTAIPPCLHGMGWKS